MRVVLFKKDYGTEKNGSFGAGEKAGFEDVFAAALVAKKVAVYADVQAVTLTAKPAKKAEDKK